MKRYLIATGVGAMVFAGALGSAAALNVEDSNPVAQFGEDMDLTCDDAVSVDGFNVDSDDVSTSSGVKVSDISTACNGKTLVVTATDNGGTQVRKAFTTIDSTIESLGWAEIPLEDLGGVRVTIG